MVTLQFGYRAMNLVIKIVICCLSHCVCITCSWNTSLTSQRRDATSRELAVTKMEEDKEEEDIIMEDTHTRGKYLPLVSIRLAYINLISFA